MTFSFFKLTCNTIIRFGFCDIQVKVKVRVNSLNIQLWVITLTSTLIILDIAKTLSNNCLESFSNSGQPLIVSN